MSIAKAMRKGLILLLIGIVVLTTRPGLAMPLAQDPVWVITYPSDGTTVNGVVSIVGTASHPNFDSYGLLYASGPVPTASSNWIPIVFGEKTMVVNGPLASWDTTSLENGMYTLALALYEVGQTEPKLFFVNNITVQNEEATPTPSPAPTETPAQAQPTPGTAEEETGPAPVGPTVEMPPTATPRPTPTLSTGETPEPEETPNANLEGVSAILIGSTLKDTFCAGVQFAVLLYVLGGIYVAGKAAWRYYRRYLRQQRRNQA